MHKLISQRLARQLQRVTEEVAYNDVAFYISPPDTTVLDDFGQPLPSTERTQVKCSFTDSPSLEDWKEYVDVQQLAAEVRLSREVTPQKGGTIELVTHFNDPSFANTIYEILGIRDRGLFGYMCALKKAVV